MVKGILDLLQAGHLVEREAEKHLEQRNIKTSFTCCKSNFVLSIPNSRKLEFMPNECFIGLISEVSLCLNKTLWYFKYKLGKSVSNLVL